MLPGACDRLHQVLARLPRPKPALVLGAAVANVHGSVRPHYPFSEMVEAAVGQRGR